MLFSLKMRWCIKVLRVGIAGRPAAVGAVLPAILALTGVWGCSAERDGSELLGPSRAGIPVVEAALVVSEPLPPVFLSRTLDPSSPFSFSEGLVSGAMVQIAADTTVYAYDEVAPGVYLAFGPTVTVEPQTVYELRVVLEDGALVTARTQTPPRFTDIEWVLVDGEGGVLRTLRTFAEVGQGVYEAPENRLVHGRGLLEARFTRPDVPGFHVGLRSLDLDSDFVVDVSFLDEEDLDQLERNGSSPILSARDGRQALPWGVVFFGGRYLVRFHAVDRNWYDLVRSLPQLGGGGGGPFGGFGGNAGDNFDEPLFHIEGGIGLFGSAAVDSVGFFVLPPE